MNSEQANLEVIRGLLTTKKQKETEIDFCKGVEENEVWDEIQVGRTGPAYRKFEIELEDVQYFNEVIRETNPVFNDIEWAAKNSPFGQMITHPIFIVAIQMYCTIKGPATWLRNPGAMNPGQKIKIYEPFFVGETINLVVTADDRYVRNEHHYMGERIDYYNQNGKLKATRWFRLITPKDRETALAFAETK